MEAGEELLEAFDIGRAAEEVGQDIDADAVHELHEDGVGLVLVFHEGILLSVGAKSHGIT